MFHLLVRDCGADGITVHGITKNDLVAQAWESADSRCRHIEVYPEASVSTIMIDFSERL